MKIYSLSRAGGDRSRDALRISILSLLLAVIPVIVGLGTPVMIANAEVKKTSAQHLKHTFSSGSLSVFIFPCELKKDLCYREKVTVSFKKDSKPELLELSTPRRLVIDIAENVTKGTKNLPVEHSEAITAVRFGMFENKARVVLDLSDRDLQFQTIQSPKKIEILFTFKSPAEVPPPAGKVGQTEEHSSKKPSAVATERPPTPSPTATTVAQAPTAAQVHQKVVDSGNFEVPLALHMPATPAQAPTASPAESVAPTPLFNRSSSRLQGIRFANSVENSAESSAESVSESAITPEPLAKENVLLISLSFRPEYRFGKIGEHKYKLTIPKIGPVPSGLLLPFFPPADVEGFVVAQATVLADDAEILITVERGFTVSAVPIGNVIVLRALTRK